ncbi:MAG: protein kinase [Deltaproteobacteria bacterium]|jgi:serine/threonine protein kinase|nr:protein kinase [Deltaproteobacteria bacterium]
MNGSDSSSPPKPVQAAPSTGSSAAALGVAVCPRCRAGYRLNADNIGRRSICLKCGQNFHLLPETAAADTVWLDTTAALNKLASRVWERGLDLRVGQVVLGVYVVQETLGRGGLGQVFKVRHQEWQQELALKLPFRNLVDAKFLQALKNEAETWVGLGLHPHVVTCYYVRPLMGVPSIFMEYVSGGSVKDLLDAKEGAGLRRGEPLERALCIVDLAVQTAWGLEHAHGRGVLHLDIKPQNLLLEEESGRLLVSDFGLARAAREADDPSDSASLWPGDQQPPEGQPEQLAPRQPEPGGFGTPQYMSPEAVEHSRPAPSFDLWALALTTLELFLGRRPWEHGAAAGAGLEHLLNADSPLCPPPPEVKDYLRRALAADPAVRFQKASEAAQELIAVHERLSGRDYPRPKPWTAPDSADNLNNRAVSLLDLDRPEEAEKLWRQALKEEPRHLASFFNLSLKRFHDKTISPEAFQGRLDDLTRLAADRPTPELPLILAGSYLELGLLQEAAAALEAYDGPALNHEARRLKEILERGRFSPHLVERARPAVHRLSKIRELDAAETADRLLAPLLAEAAAAVEAGRVEAALELLQKARTLPLPERSAELDALWRSLYGHAVRLELRDVVEERSGDMAGEAAACGGSALALCRDRRLAFVTNPQSAAASMVEKKLANQPLAVTVASDGSLAAALTKDGHLWLFKPQTGAGAGQALAHPGGGRTLAFRPDRRRLFTGGDEGELKMWDTGHGYLDKGTPLLVRKLSENPLIAMAVSSNGRILSVTDGLVEYRLSADKPAAPTRSLPMAAPGEGPRAIAALAADPFNRYLVSAHEAGLTFHPLFDTDWKADLGDLEAGATAVAVSPDARLWAVALADGRLLVGWAPDERKSAFLPVRRLETGGIHFLSFSPDNAFLLAVGRSRATVYGLDWSLETASSRSWDKRAEMALLNFMAKQADAPFSDNLVQALSAELAAAGLYGLDPQNVAVRLKEAVDKIRLES